MRARFLPVLAIGAIVVGPATPAAAEEYPVAPVAAVGIPGEDLGTQSQAGAVEVRYSDGTRQVVHAADYRAGDHFGAATTIMDVDEDEHPDLFVGAPGRDVDGTTNAGAVYLYRGSADGFREWKVLRQGDGGVPGEPQARAAFGASLHSDPYSELVPLAAGVPGWDVDGTTDAGAVAMLKLSRTADPQVSGRLLTADSAGVPGSAGRGDRLGTTVLVSDALLAAGAPGKAVGGAAGAGGVVFADLDDRKYWLLSQNTRDMPDAPEAGDGFGSALAFAWPEGLWIGVPGEDVGAARNAGLVNTFGDADEDGDMTEAGPAYTQDTPDMNGSPEAGDRFGSAIAGYPVDEDSEDNALIGVPGEDLGSVRNAGMVNGVWQAPTLTENVTAGTVEAEDRFGATLLAGTEIGSATYHLVVGAPGEDAGAGGVVVVSPDSAIWKQVTGSPEPGDGYGSALGWQPPN